LHGHRVRVVANAGHVGQCAEQARYRSALWFLRRLDRRSFWSPPPDACGNRDGGCCFDWPGLDVRALDVLRLLFDQCAWLCVVRSAAASTLVIAVVWLFPGYSEGCP